MAEPNCEDSEEKFHRKKGTPEEAAGEAVREMKVRKWLMSR